MRKIGLDIGSGTIKAVVRDGEQETRVYEPVERKPVEKTRVLLERLFSDSYQCELAVTGANSHVISQILGIPRVRDAVSVLTGFQQGYPDARTVFDIGQERSSFYQLGMEDGRLVLADFGTNSMCGAGGGALIEKMTPRLKFASIEEFVAGALRAEAEAPRLRRQQHLWKTQEQLSQTTKILEESRFLQAISNAAAAQTQL